MSEMGLRYGDEFRPIRDLSAGGGKSAGRVSLSDIIAHRAGEYPLHPVLFDGAMQILSAGAATIEGRKSQLKLPVRFAKILFLRSPGASSLVRAAVQQCNSEYVEGRIELYDEAGKPCVLVDGFRAISLSGARRSGGPGGHHQVLYHLVWERTPAASNPAAQSPVPLERLVRAAQGALDQVIATRGRTQLENAMAAGDDLAAAQLASGLQKMASSAGTSGNFTADSLRVAEPMRQIFGRLITSLVKRGWLAKEGDGHRATPSFHSAADSAQKRLRSFISTHSGHLPESLFCAAICCELGPILRGECAAVGYDCNIGTDVLHAYSDLRSTLRHIHELLVPGGSLVFMDVASPQLWTEVLFGLTTGWWRFTDRDLRPHQPLLERSQWEFVLRETGFGEIASLPGMLGPEGECQIGLLARKPLYDSASSTTETLL